MIGTVELHKRLRQAIAPTLGACVFGYFAFHAVQGDRGVIAWLQVSQQLTEGRAALTQLTAEREAVEHRVALLGAQGLDLDLLEEQARVMLNVAAADDRLVIVGKDSLPVSPVSSAD